MQAKGADTRGDPRTWVPRVVLFNVDEESELTPNSTPYENEYEVEVVEFITRGLFDADPRVFPCGSRSRKISSRDLLKISPYTGQVQAIKNRDVTRPGGHDESHTVMTVAKSQGGTGLLIKILGRLRTVFTASEYAKFPEKGRIHYA